MYDYFGTSRTYYSLRARTTDVFDFEYLKKEKKNREIVYVGMYLTCFNRSAHYAGPWPGGGRINRRRFLFFLSFFRESFVAYAEQIFRFLCTTLIVVILRNKTNPITKKKPIIKQPSPLRYCRDVERINVQGKFN